MLIEDVQPRPPLLIVVHPGSCCGAVDAHLGKYAGRAYREGVVNDVQAWNGSQWVAMKHMASPDSYDESGRWIPDAERNIRPVKYDPGDPDDPWS